MKRSIAVLALAAALLAGTTPAMAQQQDLTEEEVTSLARFAMPAVFRGLQRQCRAELPGDAYIYASGADLLARLEAASVGQSRAVLATMRKLGPQANPEMLDVLAAMPPETLEPFLEELVAGMIASKLQTENCGSIDRALQLLDPLPAENLAALVGLAVVEGQKAGGA